MILFKCKHFYVINKLKNKFMGSLWSKVWKMFFGMKDMRILMVGPDNAGKSTIFYKLKIDESEITKPVIGFWVETIEYKNMTFTMWDVCGKYEIRQQWKNYYQNTQAIIYVVDWNHKERIEETKEGLYWMLAEDELKDACLLVFANKQDLPGALTPSEITDIFELNTLKDRNWHVQGSCAILGEGLYEGFDWLSKNISKSNK